MVSVKIKIIVLGALAITLSPHVCSSVIGQEALEIYTDAGNFQNNNIFDLAVDEWERFLEKFPDHELARKAQYYLGVCRFQLKRYDTAAESFHRTIEHPQEGEFNLLEDAYLNLGSAQFALARAGNQAMYAQAAATYTKLIEEFPKDRGKHTDQALYFLGDALHAQEKPQEAARAYARVMSEFPNSPLRADSTYALAVTFDEQNQVDKALKYYDQYVRDFPQRGLANDAHMGKAEMLVRMKKYQEAANEYAQLADNEQFASSDLALLRQAFCNWHLSRFDAAAHLYSRVVSIPQSEYAAEATLMAGRSYYRAGKRDDAGNWFQRVIKQGEKNAPEATHWLCRIHLQNEQPAVVVELTEPFLEGTPAGTFHAELLLDRADALFELDDHRAQAIELYLQIHRQFPDDALSPQALYNAAFTAMELRKYEEGFAHSTTFLEKYSDHELAPDAQHVLAECKLLVDEYPAAEAIYRELIKKHVGHEARIQWQLRLGLVLFLQKKYEESASSLKPVASQLKDATQMAETFFMIGASHFHLDQFDRAAKALTAAVEADPQGPKVDETLLYLARAQRGLEQNENSLTSLQRIIESFPDSQILDQAFYWFGETSYALAQFGPAAQKYHTLAEKWPDSEFAPHALSGWGWSSYRTKKYDEGVEAFSELIARFAQHELVQEARYGRALCHRKLKDHDQAIRDFDHYLASQPEPERKSNALYLRGLALIDANRYDEAADSFEQLLRENQNYRSADGVKYQLAWAYKLLNQRSQAVQTFESLATDYPDSPYVPEARYHLGENQYWHERDYEKALQEYTTCQETSQQEEMHEKATYMMAWSCYQLQQFDRAADLFHAQAEKHPNGAHHPDALFMRAEALFKTENYDQALEAYRQVADQTSLSEERIVLTLLHGGQAAGQLEKWGESLKWLQRIDAEHGESPYLAEAMFEQGVAMFSLGRSKVEKGSENPAEFDQSLSFFQSAANRSRDLVGARARFRVGEVYFQKKMFQDAIRQYQRVMYGFGGDSAPDDVKPSQANAGFQAGQAALILAGEADTQGEKQQRIQEAKKYLAFIVEKHPESKLVRRAADLLNKL